MELKVQIIKAADILMDLLEICHDEEFIEDIVNAVACNDKATLWDWEDKLSTEDEDEEY